MIVQSLGTLATLPPDWRPSGLYGSITVYEGYSLDYATIYRTQANVRTAVDFLARNIAQLGLHAFRRLSNTDRVRLTDHPVAALVSRPNPFTTRYRLIASLVSDLAIYNDAYWLKIRGESLAILRIPPQLVRVIGNLVPTKYEVTLGGRAPMEFEPDEIVHFRGHNPSSSIVGLSPLESLRQLLLEDVAATDYRANFWRNSARMGGVIERPASAPEWSNEARLLFRQQFEALYTGTNNAGRTAILEEGMNWKPLTMSATDAQYIDARKLTREEVAAAYHIPPPLVGIMDKATFSNIQEQHRHLYTDTLGPWLSMIEDEFELQLLPEFESDGVYVEFNLAEKLKGSFEEQAAAMSTMVGAPVMTRNEARARLNLPAIDGADSLVTPLNVLIGGQASPRDSAPPVTASADVRAGHAAKWADVLRRFYQRQASAVLARKWFDRARWSRELGEDLMHLAAASAAALGGAPVDARAWATRQAARLTDDLAAALGPALDRSAFDAAIDRSLEDAACLVASLMGDP